MVERGENIMNESAMSKGTRLFSKYELEKWHELTMYNKEAIKASALVGCFYCGKFSGSVNVVRWIDRGKTGMCPECGIDSLLPESSIPALSIWLLRAMYDRWFGVAYGPNKAGNEIDKENVFYYPRSW